MIANWLEILNAPIDVALRAAARPRVLLAVVLVGLVPLLTNAQTQNQAVDTETKRAGRVLMIENARRSGDFDGVIDGLRKSGLDVEVLASNKLLPPADKLKEFDSVILADVPRSSGRDTESITYMTDDQVIRLVHNTEKLGCGLVLLGGTSSFAAGGWSGSELEKAITVDFKWVDAEKKGALVMVMHPAELERGAHWARIAARAAFEQLGPSDHCGVITYSRNGTKWLWGDGRGVVPIGDQRVEFLAKIDNMQTGDFPDLGPAFQLAFDELMHLDTSSRRIVLLTDGDPLPPDDAFLKRLRQTGIGVSVVHVDLHGPKYQEVARRIASLSGGKYYYVRSTSPQVLEKIFLRESRKVSFATVQGKNMATPVKIIKEGELAAAMTVPPPPLRGYVETMPKENAQASVSIAAIDRDGNEIPVLVTGRYGIGRTAVLTTDLTSSWTAHWKDWADRDRMFEEIVRWSLKASTE